jgi:hypothetical protein
MSDETTTVWRLVKAARVPTAFTGGGSYAYPGLWTARGARVLYTATSPSQCVLETLVHLGDPTVLSRDFLLVPAQIPTSAIHTLRETTRESVSTWLASRRSLALRVPAKLPDETLVLLCPDHPGFSAITVGESLPVP